ncbi:hypothetical protein AAVH_19940 [Aphelenchoides avenae]|nr:hypothetical protein AAVH_19940 [Aphelenchus avenae]
MKGADATVRIAFCLIVTIMLLTFIAERDGIEYLYNLGIILLPLLGLLIVFNAICYVASKRLERTTEAREDLNQLRPHEPTVATVEVGARRINPMLASVIAQLREYGNVPQVTLPTYNRAVRTMAPAKLAVPICSELPERGDVKFIK